MFRAIGFLTLLVPPMAVFASEAIQLTTGVALPVELQASIYPLGILAMLLYSLSFSSVSRVGHFVDYSKGARLGATLVAYTSCVAAFIPVFFGNLFLGPGLLLASLGGMWMPSAVAAAAYGHMIADGNKQISQKELTGTRNGGIAVLFLAWSLGKRHFLDEKSLDAAFVVFLAIFYALGWAFISQAGAFPYSLLGAAMIILVPVVSRRIVGKGLANDEVVKLSQILAPKVELHE